MFACSPVTWTDQTLRRWVTWQHRQHHQILIQLVPVLLTVSHSTNTRFIPQKMGGDEKAGCDKLLLSRTWEREREIESTRVRERQREGKTLSKRVVRISSVSNLREREREKERTEWVLNSKEHMSVCFDFYTLEVGGSRPTKIWFNTEPLSLHAHTTLTPLTATVNRELVPKLLLQVCRTEGFLRQLMSLPRWASNNCLTSSLEHCPRCCAYRKRVGGSEEGRKGESSRDRQVPVHEASSY